MTPWIRFLYVIALMVMILAPAAGRPGMVALGAFIIAVGAFLNDSWQTYVKRDET